MRSGPWWPAEFYASVSRDGRATAFNAIHIRNGPNNLGPNTLEACSHIHIQAHCHIAVLKPPAQRSSPSSRVVPGRLAVLHKLAERYRPARRKPARRRQVALHRPAPAQRKPGPCIRRREERNRRVEIEPHSHSRCRNRNQASHRPALMRYSMKAPKRLPRKRELYSSPISLIMFVLCGHFASRHVTRMTGV